MADQPANNAPNFATTEKEPSAKFAAHGIRETWFQTHVNLFRTVWEKLKLSNTIANLAKRTFFEVQQTSVRFPLAKTLVKSMVRKKNLKLSTLIDH